MADEMMEIALAQYRQVAMACRDPECAAAHAARFEAVAQQYASVAAIFRAREAELAAAESE